MKASMLKIVVLSVFLAVVSVAKCFSQGNLVNILPTDYFGFEKEASSWFIQHPDNYTIVTEKAAASSLKSLKYSNASNATTQLKAHSSSSIPEMLISLNAGTYTIKAKVWIDPAAEISAFKITLKPIFANAVFDLTSTAKGEWVEVTSQLVLNSDNLNGNLMIVIDTSNGGKGTMYFDDIQLFDEAPPVIVEIPLVSQISTIKDNYISLEKGTYDMSLKVWLDENATMTKFNTSIVNPWISSSWNMEGIEKNKWVTLKQEITLDEAAVNSEFRISINNNPEFGGGKGVFYVDDILLEKISTEDTTVLSIETYGETCVDKGNGQLKIAANEVDNFKATLNDTDYSFSKEKLIENLKSGEYDLCITKVDDAQFKRCYKFTIEKATTIQAKVSETSNKTVVTVTDGTAPFKIKINGVQVSETALNTIEINSVLGDVISVETAIACEGVFVNEQNKIIIYPNPASDVVKVNTPKGATIEIVNAIGSVVKVLKGATVSPEIAISDLSTGVYYVKVFLNDQVVISKLLIK